MPTGVRGAIHKHSITALEQMHMPKPKIKILLKQIHEIAI